jgi:hypothetical protein
MARAAWGIELEEVGFFIRSGALFGFEDKAAAFVEVDEAGGGLAVAVVEEDGAFEDVGVVAVVGAGGVGPLDAQEGAEFGEEELVIGPLRGAGGAPACEEVGDVGWAGGG